MERGEIVMLETAAVEKGNGEGIADGHGYRGAGSGSEIEGAGFLFYADVENELAGFGQRGFGIAGERDDGNFEALERFEEIQDFLGFATVGDGEESVATREHAEIAVKCVSGVKKASWRASAGKGGGDFAANQAGLAHAGDDDAAFAGEEEIDGADKGIVEAGEDVLDCLGFDAENAASGVQTHALLQRRTRVESSLRRARSWGSCARGRALGPSERAAAGLSCVSRKMPSTPVATPARARGSVNSGWPPLAWPWPPGSWTEWVTS